MVDLLRYYVPKLYLRPAIIIGWIAWMIFVDINFILAGEDNGIQATKPNWSCAHPSGFPRISRVLAGHPKKRDQAPSFAICIAESVKHTWK